MPDDATTSRTIDEAARREFERVNFAGARQPIDHFLPQRDDPRYLATLEELVHIELELAWKSWRLSGRSPAGGSLPQSVESYLARFPELADPPLLLRIVEQEFLVRSVHGDRPSAHDYCRRFPTIVQEPAELQALLRGGTPAVAEERFGERYTQVRLHAQGGLGRVWLVRDRDIGRKVALKQLLPYGRSDGELKTRFSIEARIAGQLEHPNIVPVYEVSQDRDGEQFYTMRFVDGQTLNQAVDRFHAASTGKVSSTLAQANLLNAFIAVCNAVGYAHARGIVHRDLKGDNVVLGEFGEVFVLDWGLAKILADVPGEVHPQRTAPVDLPESPHDLQTMAGDVMGTPGYMSPEQAVGETVDHTTDIYSLGAILYQILTGRLPFAGQTARELLQAVVLQSPQRPRELASSVPLALEAVCLKALAKRPQDRYASVGALADDVRRFMADEAVLAYREPWLDRAARWARRHRTWVRAAAAALLVVTLVSVAAIVLVDASRRRAEAARDVAARARTQEARERARAEANFHQARSAVDQMLTRVAEGPLKDAPHMQEVGRLLLEDALGYYRSFLDQKGEDVEVRREAARALRRVADIRTKLGQHSLASDDYREAIRLQYALLRERPDQQLTLDLSQTQTNYAHLLSATAKPQEAEAAYREALRLALQLAGEAPREAMYQDEVATCHQNLATHLSDTGQHRDAQENYEQALAIQEKLLAASPNFVPYLDKLARSNHNLGLLFRNTDRLRDAEVPLRRAVDLKRQLSEGNSHVAAYRFDLATSLNSLGILLWDLRKSAEAETVLNEAIDLQRSLTTTYPSVPDYAGQLGASLHNFAELKLGAGDLQAARAMFQEAIAFQSAALRANPSSPTYRMFLRNHLWALSDAAHRLGDHAAVSEAALKLPQVFPSSWEEYHRAAGFVAQCVRLIAEDSGLSPETKQQLGESYAASAMDLLRKAVERGFQDASSLANDEQFAPCGRAADFQDLAR